MTAENGMPSQPCRQGGDDDDQAHRLVQDHRVQRRETEQPDQKRKPEFSAAKPR